MKLKRLFAALPLLSTLIAGTALAAPLHLPDPQSEGVSTYAPAQTPSPLAALDAPDDASIGEGPYLITVFMDRGTPELRRQIIHLFAFVKAHPLYKVVIKELPLLSKESLDIAIAETAVTLQESEPVWRKFEYRLISDKGEHISPETLKSYATWAGVKPDDYDAAISSGRVMTKLGFNRRMADSAGIHTVPFFVFLPTSGTDNGETIAGQMSAARMDEIVRKHTPNSAPSP